MIIGMEGGRERTSKCEKLMSGDEDTGMSEMRVMGADPKKGKQRQNKRAMEQSRVELIGRQTVGRERVPRRESQIALLLHFSNNLSGIPAFFSFLFHQ